MQNHLLRDTPLDEALNREELAYLSQFFGRQVMAADTVLFRPGEEADALYLLVDGRIELRHMDEEAHRETIEELGAGRCFGELALLGGRKRKAQATVRDRAELLFLTRYDFERVLALRPALGVKVLAALSVSPMEGPAEGPAGGSQIIAFCAARGGVGTTTVAAATAVALADGGAGKVCYVDLDMQFGTTGFHDRNSSCRPLDALLETEDIEDYDDEELMTMCCRRGVKLWHVPPPEHMRSFDQYPGRDVVRLLARLKRCFDWVIVDLAPVLEDMALAVLDFADRLVAVSTPSARDRLATERLFGMLRSYRYGESKFALVVNRGAENHRPFQLGGGDLPGTCFTVPFAEDRLDPDEENFWRLSGRGAFSTAIRAVTAALRGVDEGEGDGLLATVSAWFARRARRRAVRFPATLPQAHRQRAAKAHLALGEALYLSGKFLRASQELRRAIEDDPTISQAYAYLGEIALCNGNDRQARSYFREGLKRAPSNLRLLSRLACLEGDHELLETCHLRLQGEVAEHPRWADLRNYLGLVQEGLGDSAGAIASFTVALKINRRYAEVYKNLGRLYHRQHKNAQAIEFFLKALTINPDFIEARECLGRVYKTLGMVPLAVKEFRLVLDLCPQHARVQREVLMLQDGVDALERDIARYEEAVSRHPHFADLQRSLGDAYFQKGSLDKAARAYQSTLASNPDDLVVKERLLELKAIQGRVRRGILGPPREWETHVTELT